MSELDNDERSSSSEEEDEDAKEITEEIEKNFLRTLSCLRKKDPRIYDSGVKFFDDERADSGQDFNSETQGKKKKEKNESMSVRQYERKLLLERGPDFIEEEEVVNNVQEPSSLTYIEEQKALKANFKKLLEASDSDDDSENLFKVKEKPVEEKKKEEKSFKQWLKGQKEDLEDKEAKKDLQYLHDVWTDPNIDETEKFLKDYILNKRYLESDEQPNKNVLQEVLSDDEEEIKKADEFEHKYNFRFEEPDREFLKRYPRNIETSMRRQKIKQEKRKLQREKAKERKAQKFVEKQKEVGELKKKKREELLQQIQKLKDITGNDKIAFEDELMDGDFDSSKFDRRMEEMFDDDFYNNEDLEKPVFEDDGFDFSQYENQEVDPEDPDFVMDCDYDPQAVKQKKLEKKLKSKDKQKNKLISNDSNDLPDEIKSNTEAFEKYIDEFYKYDFEDLIDDIPCRYKYRKVVPNSYGLTIDEILAADDDELEKWCSIKKVDKLRSDHAEKNEAKMYAEKARDEALKRKILPSLYKYKDADEFDTKPEDENKEKKKKKKKKKKKGDSEAADAKSSSKSVDLGEAAIKSKAVLEADKLSSADENPGTSDTDVPSIDASKTKQKKSKKSCDNEEIDETSKNSNANIEVPESDEIKKKKKKKKRKRSESDKGDELQDVLGSDDVLPEVNLSPKKKKKRSSDAQETDLQISAPNGEASEGELQDALGSDDVLPEVNLSPKKKKKPSSDAQETDLPISAPNEEASNNKNIAGKKKKKHSKTDSNEGTSKSSNVQEAKKNNPKTKNKNKNFKNSNRNSDKFKSNNATFSPQNTKHNHPKKSFATGNNKYPNGKFKHRNEFKPNKDRSWQKSQIESNDKLGLSDARLQAYGINPKKYKNKLIYGPKSN